MVQTDMIVFAKTGQVKIIGKPGDSFSDSTAIRRVKKELGWSKMKHVKSVADIFNNSLYFEIKGTDLFATIYFNEHGSVIQG
jgi:hypothetical protein